MSYIKNYTNTYVFHGHQYTITAPALWDEKANKVIPCAKLDDQATERAKDMYRKDMGYFFPDNLKRYRAKVGLSQRDFAQLTGLSPNTVALYEAGAFPTNTNNKLLKALFGDDDILEKYINDPTNQYPDSLVEKVQKYLKGGKITHSVDLHISKKKPLFTANQIANWFIVNNYFYAQDDMNIEPLTQMKLVKLLYFSYGRYLARTNCRLFTSKILALPYGPVVEEVYAKFNGKREIALNKPSESAFKDYNDITAEHDIFEILESIYQDYNQYSAAGLSKITHQRNSPWNKTKKGKIISDQDIISTFKSGKEE